MGKNISLFSGYSQKENRTTNYCLLILKMLYEENPKFLSGVISTITNEEIGNLVGVKFSQQEKKEYSIPDGLITQSSFSIYIETKNYNWFYDSQIKRHLEALNKEDSNYKILLALGKFETSDHSKFNDIEDLCKKGYRNSIFFKAISFEDFIETIQTERLSKNLSDIVSDFNNYLNEEDLLPTWRNWLDVINCSQLSEEVLNGNIYICPAEGGSYSHKRCKYFGMYRNKAVEKVALIEAVIDVYSDSDPPAIVKWKNVNQDDKDLIDRACKKVKEYRSENHFTHKDYRVFLLGKLYNTKYIKDTSGGMQGSKQYFDVSKLGIEDAEDLAEKLIDKTWPSQL